jgi:hypothetical protein
MRYVVRFFTRVTAVALMLGCVIAGGAVSFTAEAGAVTGPTFYVNSTNDGSSVTDCTTISNVDCGIDNAISAFNADTTPNDVDTIMFASSASPFESSDTAIDNTASGVTLAIVGNGPSATSVSGAASNPVFTNDGDTVTISNVAVDDGNSASANGGGIDNNGGTLTANDDNFSNDSVSGGQIGGAIYDFSGALTANDDTFTNDTAIDGSGGAIVSNGGTITANNDTFSNDAATNGSAGAIFVGGSSLTADDDTFSNDSASGGGNGGAIFSNGGGVSAINDTFVNDSASGVGDGGAIFYNGGSPLTVTDDTFSNDTANAGDGIFGNASGATVKNSIINVAGCGGPIADGGHNVESDNTCGFGSNDVVNSTSIDLSGALAANGSSGPETLAIGTDSSAFEAVPAASCTTATDERGDPRPGVTGQSSCDAGAFEYQFASPHTTQSQSITFGPLRSVIVGTAPFALLATATSGLTVTFTSDTTNVCTVTDATVTVLGTGTCSLSASQTGDADFSAAPSVTQSFTVTSSASLPGRPVIKATSPFKGRVRITLKTRASGATSYQCSVDGRAWSRLAGRGPFTLSRVAHALVSVRIRGVNASGSGRVSNTVRVKVRS